MKTISIPMDSLKILYRHEKTVVIEVSENALTNLNPPQSLAEAFAIAEIEYWNGTAKKAKNTKETKKALTKVK